MTIRGYRRARRAVATAILAASWAGAALGQSSGPIKYIVPLSPGGPNDLVARLMAEQIGRDSGVNLVVENRPGAGTVIGTEAVARAAPDGNTILMAAGSFVINPQLKKLSYDPLTSFEPICYLAESPQMLVLPAGSPFKNFADLRAAAMARPGELTIAANGPATTQHLQIEALKHQTGMNITFVPFAGDGPSMNAVLGQQVSVGALDYATIAEQARAGKLRPIVVGTATRLPQFPDVPTFAEVGVKDTEWIGTFGVVAPAHTPQAKIDELAGLFSKALKAPELREKFAGLGLIPKGQCGAAYAAVLRRFYESFGRAIKDANFKVE